MSFSGRQAYDAWVAVAVPADLRWRPEHQDVLKQINTSVTWVPLVCSTIKTKL